MTRPSHDIVCPCCAASITVDAATGAVLAHTPPPKKAHLSFEEAAREVEAGKVRAESKFSKALEERRHQSEILDQKFKKALEKAEKEPDARPPRPFDLD
jgi:hypothetical protein